MENISFKNIFESLVGEADYERFTGSTPSKTASASTVSQRPSSITGTGEFKGVDAKRAKKTFDKSVVDELGLGDLEKINNMLERNFIVARVFDHNALKRGKTRMRLTYPSLPIVGAMARNPTVEDPNTGEPTKKYQVVNTENGQAEEDLPVYYTINVKSRDLARFSRSDYRSARDDNMTFANETYDNPRDYAAAFGDDRLVQKTRGTTTKGNSRDAGSVGAGLVPQKDRSGIAIPDSIGTNNTSAHVFVATRHLKVSDLARFITRTGAANGIAGHFFFDVKQRGADPWRGSFIEMMSKIGPMLRRSSGTIPGTTITAIGNKHIITNRQYDNPGVDNDYFYMTENIPTPDGIDTDWTTFLSELAKTSTGFGSADEIFGGLDDETVYALYAKCAIPVMLSRIFFSKVALGKERLAGLAMLDTNVQNKQSSWFAKMVMAAIENGVEAGKSYDLPDGSRMFIFQDDHSTVKFGTEVVKDNKFVKDPTVQPLELDVRRLGGVIKREKARDVFFMMPVCKKSGGGDTFVFMRYGNNDVGAAPGNDDCTTPESMKKGVMVSSHVPIESIAFVAPDMEEAYAKFLGGTNDVDLSRMNVNYMADERVKTPPSEDDEDDNKKKEESPQERIDAILNDEHRDATDAETSRVFDKIAVDDAKRSGEFIDFSQPKEVWQKKLRELDASNSASKKPQMTDDDIDQIMSDIERSRREDDRAVEPIRVGATVDGDGAGDEDVYQDKED